MNRPDSRLPGLLLLGLIVGGLAARAGFPALESLLMHSPFATATKAELPAVHTPTLDFRGVLVEDGVPYFSIHDPATKRSAWVSLQEATEHYTVLSYDAAVEQITVRQQGRILTLTLKGMARGLFAAINHTTGLPGGDSPPDPQPTLAPDRESRRLQNVAEEIRRRRAARQTQGV